MYAGRYLIQEVFSFPVWPNPANRKSVKMFRVLLAFLLSLLFVFSSTRAADWPMFRGDAARSGFINEPLPKELSLAWRHIPAHPPAPAWPRDERMQFDCTWPVAVSGGLVCFGNSVDGKVYALDAATGEEKWSFYTDGPVRFAPTIWKDCLFVGSDDGFLYCLKLADGTLIRKLPGSPPADRVLGNERIIARRPVRGGAVVLDDVLYFAAGVWQSEGIYLHAIDPESGKTLWTNDSSGSITMPQPHGGANAKSGVSAQGYLVANGPHLFVPTGRAVPAAFHRADGKFDYYHLQANGHRGGTMTMAQGDFFYNGGCAYEAKTGTLGTTFGEGVLAAYADGILYSGKGQLAAFKPGLKDSTDRKGQPIKVLDHAADWKIKVPYGGASLIAAGHTIVCAGENGLCLVDAKSQEVIQSLPLVGLPLDLAAANGRLYVSTDKGEILCFTEDRNAKETVWRNVPEESPYGENSEVKAAAEKIIKQSKITEGYAVDLGCGDGALAFELAKRTKLHIVAVDSDPNNVAAARKKLEAAGFYGKRVSVFLGDPANTEFPKYFANLVVSRRSLTEGTEASPAEVSRLQRPYGGVACLGQPDEMQPNVRGALANAGNWSHLYSDPANTACSVDEIKGPLRVLWFRDVDVSPPQRHGRGPAPFFVDGRLFAEGLDELRAVDAYNGRPLWTFPLPGILDAYDADHLVGTAGTGSNVCIADGSVYVRHESYCYRLDAAKGEVQGKFEAPKQKTGKPGRWGYLACEDGVLFGSLLNDEHIVRHAYLRADKSMQQLFTESSTLFALEARSGKELWRYDAKKSIRNNAIAIGDNRVFLIDRELAVDDLLARAPADRRGKELPKVGHPTGELIVLDAKTGKQKWIDDKDIFGTMLVFSEKYDVLLMGYQSTRFKLPSEIGGRLAVFQATDGYRLWDKKMNYVTRPLVNDRVIYAQGGAWDLLSGDNQPFDFERSYGCGQISASKNLLLFRSATLGYKDLSRDAGTENFGGIRPGCWINAIPAGGLVLVPDASAGCRCSYQNRTWMALQGSE